MIRRVSVARSATVLLAAILASTAPVHGAGGPSAVIRSPAPNSKIRQAGTAPVKVRIRAGESLLLEWSLTLIGPGGPEQIAAGSSPVDGEVAKLNGAELEAGASYQLVLEARDAAGATAHAESSILVPDPQYTLIPLEPGNFSRNFVEGLSVDSSGEIVVVADTYTNNGEFVRMYRLDTALAQFSTFSINISRTSSQRLSRDGNRFFYLGSFREPYCIGCLAFYDVPSGSTVQIFDVSNPSDGFRGALFDVDRRGERIIFQSAQSLDPDVFTPDNRIQYYFLDRGEPHPRALTIDPDVVDPDPRCDMSIEKRPVMTADGSTAFFFTGQTLGLTPEDPAVGCRMISYDVASRSMRVAAEFPIDFNFGPQLSMDDDGRFASFSALHLGPTFRGDVPALYDIAQQRLDLPLVPELGESAGFDAVITGDANAVIVSSKSDLDPRVGNADGNMELFYYDRGSGRFDQISETIGGVDRFPGGCTGYEPRVNADGRVVLFGFAIISVPGCNIEVPQRNQADGLELGRVRAVRKRPGNQPPLFEPSRLLRVLAGEPLQQIFAATDADDDPVVFFAQVVGTLDLPAGALIEDHHDGTATFRWTPRLEQVGAYALRVAAFDEGGGEVVRDVTIAVCPRFADGDDPASVIESIFTALPLGCNDADVNGDGAVNAADVTASVAVGAD